MPSQLAQEGIHLGAYANTAFHSGIDGEAGRLNRTSLAKHELVGNLLASLAIDDFALALAVHESQIDRGAPLAVAFALVNLALTMSLSLRHDLPPCHLMFMHFGALRSF